MKTTRLARWTLTLALPLLIAIAVTPLAASADAARAGSVKVTVKYTGKGMVDGNHRLWVWLFDTPDIGPGAIPIAETSIDTNGSAATFADVTAGKVWIAIAYDEHGGFAGNAPPPTGSPVTLYTEKGAPASVTPGSDTAVSVTFDDTQRMQ